MLAFVHIEKTAGMSVHQIFKRSYGARYATVERWSLADEYFSARDMRALRRLYPRLDAVGGHWLKPWTDVGDACPGIRWWTFLREPLQRAASHYQYRVEWEGDPRPFEEWVRLPRQRNFQTQKLVGSEDFEAAIRVLEERFFFVGLSEHFDESLVMLQRFAGDPRLRIAYRAENVAPDNTIKRGLLSDPATREQLEDANRADLELYRYVRDELYPRQREKYGPGLAEDVAAFQRSPGPPRLDSKLLGSELKRYALMKPCVYVANRLRR